MSTTAQNSARARIAGLLDENSFVEIGGMVTARSTDFNLKQMDTPSDGVVTGYGVINNMLVYVYSQDASVLNGTMGEMHAKKIAGLYDMAMKMGAPIIGLIDCAGLRLQEAMDGLNAFGEIYRKQTMASGVIPQVTAIFGSCGGGLSIVPALADFTFMETEKGKLFTNAPNAIDENSVDKCDTASAAFQSEETGNVDGIGTEAEVLGKIRSLVAMLPANNEAEAEEEPVTDDLNRICENMESAALDPAVALSMISDNQTYFEVKENYAKDMVTAFIKLNGATVGAVANRAKLYDAEGSVVEEYPEALSPRGCEKAAEFVNFCDAFQIPVLTLTNVEGFKSCLCAEKKIGKAAARLTYAFANATVPKVNVVTGKAFGSAYNVMNSKALGADMVFAWPSAKIGMMNAQSAAKIMYAEEIKAAENAAALIKEKAAEYDKLQSSALSAAKRGYVDTIIESRDTRKYVIGAFEMLYSKREERPFKKHGTV